MNDGVNIALAGLADMHGAGAATAFHKAHNGNAVSVATGLRLAFAAALICFVNFDGFALAAERRHVALRHGKTEAVGDKPRRLEGAAKGAVKLVGANALLAAAHEMGGLKPQVQRQAALLEDRALADGELLAAVVALPEAIDGLALGIALGGLGGLDGQSAHALGDATVGAMGRLSTGPHDAL